MAEEQSFWMRAWQAECSATSDAEQAVRIVTLMPYQHRYDGLNVSYDSPRAPEVVHIRDAVTDSEV